MLGHSVGKLLIIGHYRYLGTDGAQITSEEYGHGEKSSPGVWGKPKVKCSAVSPP
jgi:hypothetical protein